MLEKLSLWVGKYPKTIIVLIISMTVFFYFGLNKLDVSGNMESMLSKDDPARIAYNQVTEEMNKMKQFKK